MQELPIDPNIFWDRDHVYNPSLTARMISEAENHLGVRLPDELIKLLQVQNGGYTTGFVFAMDEKTSWADDHVPCDELAGINLERGSQSIFNLVNSSSLSKQWNVPEKQILLAGDGHFWITLDYRLGEIPMVAWIDTECDEDIRVAATFRTFLAGLVPGSEFEYSDYL